MRRQLGARALGRIPPHITLVPPLDVPRAELPAVLLLLERAAGRSRPLTFVLGPPATFFPPTPVVYLEVAGDLDALEDLRLSLCAGPLARVAGRRRERRPFVPHLTLDQRIDPARIPAALGSFADYRGSADLDELTLLSFDEESGRWDALAAAPLGRGGQPAGQ